MILRIDDSNNLWIDDSKYKIITHIVKSECC